MTITKLGNTAVLKIGKPIVKNISAPLFKASLEALLSDIGSTAENVSAEKYKTLCDDSDEQTDNAEITDEEEETTITSCLDCDAKFECEHYKNGGNDILADNGWTVTVSKKNGGSRILNKLDEQPELDLPTPKLMTDLDLSNIHLPAELLKKRRPKGYKG